MIQEPTDCGSSTFGQCGKCFWATTGNRCKAIQPSCSRYVGEPGDYKLESAGMVRCQRYPEYVWRAPWEFCGEYKESGR